ncbi:MAG: hypothetical protein AAFZ18_35645 [Myxococcota bacterium]
MGYARWSPTDWARYTKAHRGRSRHEIFSRSEMMDHLDPRHAGVRESRDSDINPCSNPIIVAVDVTGSMGFLAEALVRRGLGTVFRELLDRRPVSDPHLMVMGLGDAWCDRAPLQVSQFEADIRIAEQLEEIYLEGGGGGNAYESYNLPWYFAATRTSLDSFEKRGRKGYLFTVGDEPPPPVLLAEHIRRVIGDEVQADLDSQDVLAMAARTFHLFHVVVEEGHYAKHRPREVLNQWRELLGQRVLCLSDHERLAEVIVSAIEVNEGSSPKEVTRAWSDRSTRKVVERAVRALVPSSAGRGGLVRF